MSKPVVDEVVPHHVCVNVPDREGAIAWWHDMFGFDLEFRFEIPHIKALGAFIRKGAIRVELFEIAGSAPVPQERLLPNTDLRTQGTKHFCFSVENAQSALERLHAAGVRIAGVARGKGPMREEADPTLRDDMRPASAFFITDPWGSLIEILDIGDYETR